MGKIIIADGKQVWEWGLAMRPAQLLLEQVKLLEKLYPISIGVSEPIADEIHIDTVTLREFLDMVQKECKNNPHPIYITLIQGPILVLTKIYTAATGEQLE